MIELIETIKKDSYAKFLGIEIEKIENGYSRCSVKLTRNMINFSGIIHGGLIFSLADVAFSAASNFDKLYSYALDISGSFLKTAKVADIIFAEAKLIHTTQKTGLYRMNVFNNDELLATFNGTVYRKGSKIR